ncbi:hypothetical protein F4604DRAFT_1933090 [Suillus subluteus]|nr:hypothetical protein F4604DRAFT_1933090 [Suillus subluteus]
MVSITTKLETSPNIPCYYSAKEFISDMRLVFSNCITFNGPDHLPPPAEPKPPVVKKVATLLPPPPPPAPSKKATAAPVRHPSTLVPVIRRNEAEQASGWPKREIHPPPLKDLPYADALKQMCKVKQKQYQTIAALFYELVGMTKVNFIACDEIAHNPTDAVKLDIPTYYKVIKKPMDMSTVRKKLEARGYYNASKFFDDFKLMIRNCFLFNPTGTPVNQTGIELQQLFDKKWKNLLALQDACDDEEEEYEDEDEEEECRITIMEAQIKSMHGNLMALKAKPTKVKKKKEKKEKAPVASTSKATTLRAPEATPVTNRSKHKTTTKKPMAKDTYFFPLIVTVALIFMVVRHETYVFCDLNFIISPGP